ncbi:MAG: mechanosensitive ion channel family protein [Acidimicrobiales bacterium]
MARPLWKDLRAAREQRSLAPLTTLSTVPLPPRPRWKLAATSALIAIAALALRQAEGASLLQHGSNLVTKHLWTALASGAFLVFGAIAIRRVATQVSRVVHVGAGPTAANALRVILTIVGLVVIVIVTIIMVGVNPTKLLAAAGVTGVIIGLAAQQSLGNVFAGLVLMIARPFTVGQRVRVRSGSFGGIFDGEVLAMGLTYVEFMTDDGFLRVPNLGILAAAVGPAPKVEQKPEQKSLYVNTALPKRPPRSQAPHGARRPPRQPRAKATVRRPREIIRQMRQRRSEPGEGPVGGTTGGS